MDLFSILGSKCRRVLVKRGGAPAGGIEGTVRGDRPYAGFFGACRCSLQGQQQGSLLFLSRKSQL